MASLTAPFETQAAADGAQAWRAGLADRAAQVYVIVWLFEGTLRKWGPAAFGTPLYFARDGIVIAVLLVLLLRGDRGRKVTVALVGTEVTLAGLVVLQLIVSTLPVAVGIVGVRQYLAPLLFAHLVVKRCDGRLSGSLQRIVLAVAPLEAVLCLAQSLSPAQSFLNQTGPNSYGVIYSGGDVARASGTFTAAYGTVSYLMIALPLALGLFGAPLARGTRLAQWNRYLFLPSLLLTCMVSGSRTSIFLAVACMVVRLFIAIPGQARMLPQLTRLLIPAALAAGLALYLAPGVLTAFQERFSNAEQTQSTPDRLDMQLFGFTKEVPGITFLGDGLGVHSQGGIAAGSTAPWIENETGRWMREGGLVGILLTTARFAGAPVLAVAAWRWARRCGRPEILLLACVMAGNMAGGLLNTQPTQQGATAIIAALILLPLLGKVPENSH